MAVRGLCGDQHLSASPQAGEDQFTAGLSRGVVCPLEANRCLRAGKTTTREPEKCRFAPIAERAGDRILELATNERRGGFSWRGFPSFPGLPKDAYFPNFEGGTAGVAYVFARLYSETKRAKYLFAAKQGALHLQSIATLHGNAAFIPYRFPDLPDLYYLGFCHGPAGTAHTFFELYKITREPEYQVWTERLAQGVLQSGIPDRRLRRRQLSN